MTFRVLSRHILPAASSVLIYAAMISTLYDIFHDSIFLLIVLPVSIISWYSGRGSGYISALLLTIAAMLYCHTEITELTAFRISLFVIMLSISFLLTFLIDNYKQLISQLAEERGKLKKTLTAKQKKEIELKNTELRLRSIFENANIGFYRITPEGSIVMVNPALLSMMKYPFFEIVFQQDMGGEYFPHNNMPEFKATLEQEGKIIGQESEWTRYDGTKIYFHETAWKVEDENGETKYYDGIIADISDKRKTEKALEENMKKLREEIAYRKKAEETLKESEEKYKDLVENANIAIMSDDRLGNITYCNKQSAELFGYTTEEVLQMNLRDFVQPDNLEETLERHLSRIEDHDVPTRFEFRGKRKDGSLVMVEVMAVMIKKDDKITGTRSYMWNITERKKAEAQLKESEERLRGMFDNALVGFYRSAPDGRILLANQALVKIFGVGSLDLLKQKNMNEDLNPEYDRKSFKEILESHGVVYGREAKIKRYDGETIYIRESAWTIRDKQGDVNYYEGIIEDISKWKETERNIEKLQKNYDELRNENKLLGGLLPICTSCRKIKNKHGEWVDLNEYLKTEGAEVLSNIKCPACRDTLPAEGADREASND